MTQRLQIIFAITLAFCFLTSEVSAVVVWGSEAFPDANGTNVDPLGEWTTNSTDCNLFDGGSFDVQSNQIEGEDLDGIAVWKTQTIDISGYPEVQFSLDLDDNGNSLSADDTVWVYYTVDGGSEVLLYKGINDLPASPETISAINISGSDLVIIVKMFNNVIGEKHTIDNILVEDFTPVTYYSRGTGNWSVAASWSTDDVLQHTGAAAASIPNAMDVFVEIGAGHTITANGSYDMANLTVKNTSTLQFSGNNRILDINNNGTIDIQEGGSLDRNGTSGSRFRYTEKGLYEIISNGLLFDIGRINTNLEESAITLSGSTDITLQEHFNYNDPGTEIINNNTGTLTVPLVRFKNIDQKFTNNGTIVCNEFERESGTTNGCVITNNAGATMTINTRFDCGNHTWDIHNYGTLEHNGTWFNVTAGEVNIYNYAGATYNFSGATTSDGDVYLYANYASNEVNYDRAGNQTILIPRDAYSKLTVSGSGTKTPVAGALDVNDSLSIEGAAILDVNANNNNINLAGAWTNSTGIAGTFIEGTETVTLDGTGTQEITNSDDEIFYNLIINKSAGSVTIETASDVEVTNQLTMTQGTFETGTRTLEGAGNIVATGGTINFGKTLVTLPEMLGTITCTGGTFTFNGAGDQTIKGTPGAEEYHAVLFDGSGTKTLAGDIDVDSTFTIDAGATVDVSGTPYSINVEGNWNNTGAFTEQTGTVTFDGSQATTITHATEETFYNLTINNTEASNAITLNSDVRVSNLMTFTDGHVVSSTTNTLKISTGGSTSGESDASHVIGAMEKDMNSSTLFEFPIGTGLEYRRGGITPAGAGATTYRMEYIQNKHPVADPTTIDHVSTFEYWNLERLSGSENCTVRLSYLTSSVADDQPSLLVANYDGTSDWNDECSGCTTGGTTANGWIESANLFSFGTSKYFTLACNNPALNPLQGDLYSRNTSTWSDITNWSYTEGGASCGCKPTVATNVYIRTGETLDIDEPAVAKSVNILTGGTLRWTTDDNLQISSTGIVDVDGGGTLDKNGRTGILDFVTAGTAVSITNDGTMSLYGVSFSNTGGSAVISGGTGITIADDIVIESANISVTNNNTSTINLDNSSTNGDIRFKSTGQSFTNNGTITVGRNISFENDNSSLTNNGTLTTTGDVSMAGTTDDNNLIINGASGTFNVGDDIDLNSSIFRVNNYGIVDMAGEFVNVESGEGTFYNYSGSTWRFAGANTSDADVFLYCDYSTNIFEYDGGAAQNVYAPQDAYNALTLSNTGTKTSQGNLVINGNLSISGSASLDVDAGNDNITLVGNWTNTSTAGDPFVQGTETITLSGTTQTLITNSNGETFYNLVVNKTADTVVLNTAVSTDLRIASGGLVTMTSGLIQTTSSETLTISDNSGMIGASATSYVNGPLTKEGDDDFTFNVGTDESWAPVVLEGNTEGETFTVGYSDQMYGDTSVTGVLKNVSATEYWDITDGGLVGGNDVDITLHWKDQSESGITDAADLVVAHFNGTDWEDYGQNAIDFANPGWIKVTGISGFSPFTFGSKSAIVNPLPVELTHFRAEENGDAVDLFWATGAEINNDYFSVEKSTDLATFFEIGQVAGAGNSFNPINYHLKDYSLEQGTVYYRLKQVDFDGTYTHSPIVSVSKKAEIKVNVFPNPISETPIYIALNGVQQEHEILLVLYNSMGHQVFSKMLVNDENEVLTAIDISKDLIPGIYYIVGTNKQELFRKRIVIL